jgi:hypothetical protein
MSDDQTGAGEPNEGCEILETEDRQVRLGPEGKDQFRTRPFKERVKCTNPEKNVPRHPVGDWTEWTDV